MKKLYSIILLALISMGNAIYLSISAFNYKGGNHEKLFCDVNDTFSCSSLFSFDFSWIFGIPFPAIAMIVYPIIAILAFLGLKGKIKNYFKIIFIISIMGMCFNGYIIYNEFIIGIFCLACLACSLAITTIAIVSFIGAREKCLKNKNK